jgi:hypothetical protein
VIRKGGADQPYEIVSDTFAVSPWDGLQVTDLQAAPDGEVSFAVDPNYPLSYQSSFPYVNASHMKNEADRGELRPGDNNPWCDRCSYRPWATKGEVVSAFLTIERSDGSVERVPAELEDGRWVAPVTLRSGDVVFVAAGDAVDNYRETNATASDRLVI